MASDTVVFKITVSSSRGAWSYCPYGLVLVYISIPGAGNTWSLMKKLSLANTFPM